MKKTKLTGTIVAGVMGRASFRAMAEIFEVLKLTPGERKELNDKFLEVFDREYDKICEEEKL